MDGININVNPRSTAHINVEVAPGKVTLVFSKVLEGKGDEKYKLEPIARVDIPASSKDEAKYTSRHLRWCFGMAIKAFDARESEVNTALVRVLSKEEKLTAALKAKEQAELELLELETEPDASVGAEEGVQ